MTSYCVLNLVEQMRGPYCDIETKINILKPVSLVSGTTANLRQGDSLSVKSLIYGMMLPSGNDAAQALGVYFGQLLLSKGKCDPNQAMVVFKDDIDRKLREVKIQVAFKYNRD